MFGNIYISKNITCDSLGYIRLSYSPRLSYSTTQDANFDNPAVILWTQGYEYFVATWDDAFSVDERILSTPPTQIVTAGVPTTDLETDATWFNGLMVVSQDTDVDYYNPGAGTWTDTNISLTADGQHAVVNFISLGSLAIANVNTVGLYSAPITATPTLRTTLTINSDFEITGMCYFNQNLYIATQNIYNQHAFLFIWNGTGTAAQAAYEVDSNIIFSVCSHDNAVYLTTGNGALLRFNGGGFDQVGAFPIFYTDQALTDVSNISMYKNTLKSNGNLLFIAFTNENNDNDRLLSMPDGVWCYDKNVGLYHRYSYSNSLVTKEDILTTSVNTTTNEITVASAPVTGTEFIYRARGGTALAPLTDETKYFVIRVNSTTIKIAETYANAMAGTAIDLTGTGSNFQDFVYFPNIDYGQYFNARTTALYVIERPVPQRNRQLWYSIIWRGVTWLLYYT